MMKYKTSRLFLILAIFIILGCGSVQQLVQETPTLKFTETPALTSTSVATSTRKPTQTATPDVAATMQVEQFHELVSDYFDSEFLETVYGEYYSLEDSIQNLANKGYYKWTSYGVELRNFILRTNVRMSTADKLSSLTGCAVVFRAAGNFNESIFVLQDGNLQYSAGNKNYKSLYYGRFENPAEFELVLVVNEKNYQVYIDGKKSMSGVSVFTPSKGEIGFAVQSGSNERFGSQCKFTNSDLWIIRKK